MVNRSVPVDTVLPHIVYKDVGAAIAWLSNAFGFAEHYRYGDPEAPQGAQMYLGGAWIMLESSRAGRTTPNSGSALTQSVTIFLEDVRAHYLAARLRGVKIVEELNETMYGELQYAAEDLDGHRWLFAQHVRDVSPGEWGARFAD